MPDHLFASARLLVAIAWLLGMYYATPIFGRRYVRFADRVRDALVLAVAIPFCLGFVGALTSWTCVAAAIVLFAFGRFRKVSLAPAGGSDEDASSDRFAYAIVAATLIAVAWPQFVRPPLDGDSLAYHLPNAASWATTHSFWTTATLYWWYPPGSELLASDMLLVGGVGALPLAGTCAALMLGCRLVAFARVAGCNAWQSGAVAAAFVSVPMVGLQAGTLQNDLWLSAWLLEIVWALPREKGALYRAVGMAALVKPVGIVFVLVAWAPLGLPVRAIVALAPLGLWVLRDAIAGRSATITFAQTATIDPFGTSVAAHGLAGLETLGRAIADQGIATIVLATLFVVAPFVTARRRLWLAALACTVVFLLEPYGFDNGAPQLATGQSLRYFLPALGIAFVAVLDGVARVRLVAGAFASILVVVDSANIDRIFWNDASTHAAPLVAIVFLGALLCAVAVRRHEITWAALVALAFYASANVSREPIRYYEAEFAGTRAFAWLASQRPRRAIVWDLRSGMVVVVLPKTVVEDATTDPCVRARDEHAIVIAADTFAPDPSAFARRRAALKTCGSTSYEDPTITIVSPR